MGWQTWAHRIAMTYSLGCIVLGRFLAYTFLHHHNECDMTWSQRRFLELPLPTETPYRLFKFTDARDLRYKRLFQQSHGNRIEDTSWCGHNNSVPILFIPGHAGDYQQARSLGAHAIQMTARSMTSSEMQAAIRNLHNSSQLQLDLYAVDFNEEWTALHGFYATRQARFVEQAIQRLISACEHYESILLVGHSMGGLVSLAAAKAQPAFVNTIVTLATPHQKLVTYEPQLWKWHASLAEPLGPANLVLLSISGGLRDELVPPELTRHRSTNTFFGLSFMGPDLMEMAQDADKIASPCLGMDHRAIVWCRNLLAPLRGILTVLAQTRRSKQHPQEILQAVSRTVPKKALEFKESIHRQYETLYVSNRLLRVCIVWLAHLIFLQNFL